jgi:hypothetical protein
MGLARGLRSAALLAVLASLLMACQAWPFGKKTAREEAVVPMPPTDTSCDKGVCLSEDGPSENESEDASGPQLKPGHALFAASRSESIKIKVGGEFKSLKKDSGA